MTDQDTVSAARAGLGRVGALLPVSPTVPTLHAQRDAIGALEHAGYGAAWVNETVGGKDALVQLALLATTSGRLALGTCIANIWAHPATAMHAAAAQLAEALPGRFVLGVGVGNAEQAAAVGRDFGRPVATMRHYLDRMSEPTQPPASDAPYPRLVAANGPRMLDVAADFADGALPAGAPPEFTATARDRLGNGALLVVFVPAGNDTATLARRHLDAGADHVVVSAQRGVAFAEGVDALVSLAPSVT